MTTQTEATVSENLRTLADLIEAHPDLPLPYAVAYGTTDPSIDVHWYLHLDHVDLPEEKAIAARIVLALGGKWDKFENGEDFRFKQDRGGLKLDVVVHRAAVCERVVTGSHEVTMPATAARPAAPERVETVEDVTWICSSLLAEPVSA